MKKSILIFIFLFFIINDVGFTAGIPYWGPILSCNRERAEGPTGWYGRYTDPCSSICDLLATLQNAIYLGITIALFILAPILFLIGGFYLVISLGNPERVQKGKKMLTNTAWGVVVVLLSFVIVNTFLVVIAPKVSDNVNFAKWNEINCRPEELPGTVNWINIPDKKPDSQNQNQTSSDSKKSKGVTESW